MTERSLTGRGRLWLAAVSALCLGLTAAGHGQALAEERALKLYNLHTHEKATIVFKRNGVYDQAGLKQINEFLRDWRQEKSTKMDPRLYDLVWEVYRETGSQEYINVICGYRSPDTNEMLRRRSKGVAENSLHMKGQALDFAIPGVDLAKLRAIGLRLQEGGVGFYPTSGSPFVHLDTGNVRHWPRMTRQQLVKVFPNGNTLHIPSDGKPLPGYQQAQAAYKARQASGAEIAVASVDTPAPAPKRGRPIVVAAVAQAPAEAKAEAPARHAVAVASSAAVSFPLPRLAPRPSRPIIAAAAPLAPAPNHGLDFDTVAAASSSGVVAGLDFGSPQTWAAPAVPAALAAAMAERDRTRRGASVPITPTAVVATIDVSRPLRAAAITTAVLRGADGTAGANLPEVLAYAPVEALTSNAPVPAAATSSVPLPQPSPERAALQLQPATRSIIPAARMQAPPLTMTNLDTQGLRLWIGPASTRQRAYALLTMPDASQSPGLLSKPEISFAAGFAPSIYPDLRTDHFAGPLVVQPAMVDLTARALVTAAR